MVFSDVLEREDVWKWGDRFFYKNYIDFKKEEES